MATKVAARHPKLGRKAIYLPNFTLTFLRTPHLPPTFASFIVPLNINKLDLRDYLWNLYGINSLAVRSYIQMQKLRQDKPSARRPSPRKWFRPKPIKKMMVEMEKPFVWPEELKEEKDLEPWDKKLHQAASKERDEFENNYRPDAREKPSRERKSMKEQARELLEGRARWRAERMEEDQWEDAGEAVEVGSEVQVANVDVDVPRIQNVVETPKAEEGAETPKFER